MIERYIIADDLIFDNELGRWLALEEVRDQLNTYEKNMSTVASFMGDIAEGINQANTKEEEKGG